MKPNALPRVRITPRAKLDTVPAKPSKDLTTAIAQFRSGIAKFDVWVDAGDQVFGRLHDSVQRIDSMVKIATGGAAGVHGVDLGSVALSMLAHQQELAAFRERLRDALATMAPASDGD